MLVDIFSGHFGRPMDRPMLTEAPWSMNELKVAIRRAKNKRTGDDVVLVAELMKHAPEGHLEALLDVFRHALSTRQIPTSWQTTIFKPYTSFRSACARKEAVRRQRGATQQLFHLQRFSRPLCSIHKGTKK